MGRLKRVVEMGSEVGSEARTSDMRIARWD